MGGSENVCLNQPVSNVTYLSDGTNGRNVYVTTKNGYTYRCFRAIMALPPNILREVEFTPSLDSAKKVHFGIDDDGKHDQIHP